MSPGNGVGPPNEVGPGTKSGATSTTPIASRQSSSGHRRQDGYQVPAAGERYEAWLLDEAARLGYRLSVTCVDCHRPLADAVSVAHHRGPVCRRRQGVFA